MVQWTHSPEVVVDNTDHWVHLVLAFGAVHFAWVAAGKAAVELVRSAVAVEVEVVVIAAIVEQQATGLQMVVAVDEDVAEDVLAQTEQFVIMKQVMQLNSDCCFVPDQMAEAFPKVPFLAEAQLHFGAA